jgi:hypothetical protein
MKNIKYIILEQIISEGRLEDVIKKYSDVDEETIRSLSGNDPSGNNKYLEWMVKSIIETPESGDNIIEAVKCFHSNLNRLNDKTVDKIYVNALDFQKNEIEKIKKAPKDINSYTSYRWIEPICEYFEELRPITASRVKIWEDDRWLLISPLTHAASCKYGIHSNWCVSTSNESYWNRYSNEGPLIFWLDKQELHPTRGKEIGNYKIAVHIRYKTFENPIQWNWYSMEDDGLESSFMLTILPKAGIEACKKYVGDIVKNKRSEFNKFFDTLKPYVMGITEVGGHMNIFPKMVNGVIQYFPFLETLKLNTYRYENLFEFFNNYNDGGGIPYVSLDIQNLMTDNIRNITDYLSTEEINYSFLKNLADKNVVRTSEIIRSINEYDLTKDLDDEAKKEIAYKLVLDFYKIMGNEDSKLRVTTNSLSVGDAVEYKEKGRKYYPGTKVTVTRVTDKSVFLSNDKRTTRSNTNYINKIVPPPKLVDDTIREQRWIRKHII